MIRNGGPIAEDLDPRAEAVALDGLARRFAEPLRRFFVRRLRGGGDADDMVQEVFLNLTRAKARPISNPASYVFQTASNVLKDRSRRRLARAADLHQEYRDEAHQGVGGLTPERELIGRQTLDEVVAALENLPEAARVAFLLNRLEGLRHREIAERMGVSQSSVEKYIMRATAHLAQSIGDPL